MPLNTPRTILFLVLVLSCLAEDRKELSLNQSMKGSTDSKTTVGYTVSISDKKADQNVFIRAEGTSTDPLTTPILTVKSGNCEQLAPVSLCVLSGSDAGDSVDIDANCMTECEYTLEVFASRAYNLDIDEEIQVMFPIDGYQFEVIVEIPDDLKFNEIKLLAYMDNPEEVTSGLQMFVNAGDTVSAPTSQSNQFTGDDIWNDGVGVFLNSSTVKSGQTIRAVVTGSKGTQVIISCYSVQDNQREISINQKLYDDVAKNATKIYTVDLTDQKNIDNADIYIKMTKYTGKSKIQVSPSRDFSGKVLQGDSLLTVTQIALTPNTRKDYGFSNKFYVSVFGSFASTYILQTSIQTKNFTLLDDQVAELSTITGKEVDNYLYVFSAAASKNEDDNMLTFTVGTLNYKQDVQFAVRKCTSFETDGSYGCIVSDKDDVNKQISSFGQISGKSYKSDTFNFLTFTYDLRQCGKTADNDNLFRCAFHIVVFADSDDTATYILTFNQQGYEVNLQEGVAEKTRAKQGQVDLYYFAMQRTDDVVSVSFYLTEISGDCVLTSSADKRALKIGDPGVDIATDNYVKYDQPVDKKYYLRVEAYSASYYTLTAIVKRNKDSNDTSSDDKNPMFLPEGISQMMEITPDTELRFYISLNRVKDFYVQTNCLQPLQFQVHPSHEYNVVSKTSVTSSHGYAQLSSKDVTYTSSNEFIVIVNANTTTLFSIVYNKIGLCSVYKLGQAVTVWVDEQIDQCFSFMLPSKKDVEVVVATSYFEMTTGNMNVSLSFNGDNNDRQLSQRVTIVKAEDVGCDGANSDCVMEVSVDGVEGTYVTIVAQYLDDEMQLFDGISQVAGGYLSMTKGRYFYYDMDGKSKPMMVSLKSSSNTNYRIIGKLTDWTTYLNSEDTELYPKYTESSFASADTTSIGTTAMILKGGQLKDSVKNNTLLLVSVFSNKVEELFASFNVQVVQSTVKLMLGANQQGFVEQGQTKRYLIQSDGQNEIIVHANSYQIYCVRLELFETDQANATAISKSVSGQLMISPSDTKKRYAVDVVGISACAYEISYSTADEKVFELTAGQLFNVQLKPNDKVYFLYYNSRNESFRVVSMSEYGMVEFNAKTLQEVGNMSKLLKNVGHFEFGGPSHDASLVVQSNSSDFCVNCYYLIEVSSEDAASTVLVLHYLSSPVTLRENRVTRQTLTNGTTEITYALFKLNPFKLSINLLFGSPHVSITTSANKSFSIEQDISESTVIDVPYNDTSKNDTNMYDDAAFLITVKCQSECSFTLSVDILSYAKKLVEGLPYTASVTSAKNGSCLSFLSMEKDTSSYFHIVTSNTSNLAYEVNCYNKDTWTPCTTTPKKLLIDTDKNGQNINLELKSIRGLYYICLKLVDQKQSLKATVLYSQNINLRYVLPNTNSLMTSNHGDPPSTIEMYSPQSQPVMVEVFQCIGDVNFEATGDYRKFVDNGSNLAEHAKTAGHYVVRLDPSETNSSMYFARVQVKNVRYVPNATFLFRYCAFDPKRFVYSALGADDYHIEYNYKKNKISFRMKTVQPSQHFNVMSYEYKLFIGKDAATVKSAVQCEISKTLNQSIHVSPNQADTTDDVVFQFNTDDIQQFLDKDAVYYYVSASCIVQVVDATSDAAGGSQSFKFIYDTVQLSLTGTFAGMGNFKIKMKFVFLWVIFPVLIGGILIFFAVRYCINKVKELPHTELIEEDPGEPQQNNPQGTTAKHLVGMTATTQQRPIQA